MSSSHKPAQGNGNTDLTAAESWGKKKS